LLGWWSGLGDGAEQIEPAGETRKRGKEFPVRLGRWCGGGHLGALEVEFGAAVGRGKGGSAVGRGMGAARWWQPSGDSGLRR
jgi:hypothetical protein